MYLLIKYIKSVLWRVAKCLPCIEEARCLKVNDNMHKDAVAAGAGLVHRAKVTAHNLPKVQLLVKNSYRKLRNACTELHATVKWPHRYSRCAKHPQSMPSHTTGRWWHDGEQGLVLYVGIHHCYGCLNTPRDYPLFWEGLRKHHLRESAQEKVRRI